MNQNEIDCANSVFCHWLTSLVGISSEEQTVVELLNNSCISVVYAILSIYNFISKKKLKKEKGAILKTCFCRKYVMFFGSNEA